MTLKEYVEARKNGITIPTRSKPSKKNNRRQTEGKRQQRRESSEEDRTEERTIEQTRSLGSTAKASKKILICECGSLVKYVGHTCEDCWVDISVRFDPKKIHNINTFVARKDS